MKQNKRIENLENKDNLKIEVFRAPNMSSAWVIKRPLASFMLNDHQLAVDSVIDNCV